MTTQQQLIMDAIIDKMNPYRVTVDKTYNNVGYIRCIDDKTLLATRSLHFDFQETNCTFKVPGDSTRDGIVASHYYGRPRRDGQIAAVKSTPMEAVDTVVNYLKGCTSDDPNNHQGDTCPLHEKGEAT
jgi:hypothetical protein